MSYELWSLMFSLYQKLILIVLLIVESTKKMDQQQ